MYNDSLGKQFTHSVKTLLTLIWYYWRFRAHGGCKYVNMSGILVYNLSDCLYKLRQISFVELERGKLIRYNCTKVLRNSVRTYSNPAFARQWCQLGAIHCLRIRKRNFINSLVSSAENPHGLRDLKKLTSPCTWSPIQRPRYMNVIMIVILNLLTRIITNPAWNMYVLKKVRNRTIIAKIIQISWILQTKSGSMLLYNYILYIIILSPHN